MPEKLQASPTRLISLDAFRGFTIAAMIMVNSPGSWSHVYPPLLHADWHGLTPTDLIFPFFVFIVGVSIVLAFNRRMEAGVEKGGLYRKIASRSVKIFAVGIFLHLFPDFNFETLRVAGVLQRIAIIYAVCAILFLNSGWKTQALTGAGILVVYWLAMVLIPTPGVGKVMLEPGMNLAAWIDSYVVPGSYYRGQTWDPEGFFSTFPAIVTGISGLLAGKLLVGLRNQDRMVIWLFLGGFITFLLGIMWGWVFPVNKHIWTSSFVLITSGLAGMTLSSAIFLIDMLGYRRGIGPGVIFGANAITAYALASMLIQPFYRIQWFGGQSLSRHFMETFTNIGFDPRLASVMYALIYVGIVFIPIWFLYKKKIFIKL
jgi:predicted acyltransferase